MTTRRSSSPAFPPPRFGTPRNHRRPTLGPAVGRVAARLGTPLMPHQQHVVDVALEVDPLTERLVYREVVLLGPRQGTGKTALSLAVMTHRGLAKWPNGPSRTVYTAQTRAKARQKWEDTFVAAVEASPLAKLARVRRRTGAESIVWRPTRSILGIDAPTEDAGHGDTTDLAVLDEAWSHHDSTVEQGISPTMLTRQSAQLWVPSAAGTVRSEYLRAKVDAGREHAAGRSVAYFEWSAPEDADPGDPATWWACMPGLGHTVTEDAVRGEFERLDLVDFRRAYLAQWPDEMPLDEWAVIGRDDWRGLADPGSTIVGPVAMAIDVTPERSLGSIAVAGRRTDGRMHVELADHREGVGWIPDRALEVGERWRPCVLIVDAGGPAGSLIPKLQAKGLPVTSPTVREIGQWTGALIDATDPAESGLRHLDQGPLTVAVAGGRLRPLGDASAWARRGPSVAISPLVAVTLAGGGHVKYAPLAGRPRFYDLSLSLAS